MKVRDSHSRVWRVSRRWVPWRRRLELDHGTGLDLPDGGDDLLGCLLGVVALVLAIPVLVVLVLTAVEALLLVLLLPFAVAARVVTGRHWHVEVRHGFERVWEVDAGDWAGSRAAIVENAELLRRDEHPAQAGLSAPSPRLPRGAGGRRARRAAAPPDRD